MKRRELLQFLKKNGARFERQGGNHEIWISKNGKKIPIPRHAKDLKPGTIKAIIKELK